jgi:UDP-N-acetylglucosamine 2-epimerase
MFLHIVGARPNFPKVKPLMSEMRKNGMFQKLLHTGQHYDYLMSKIFFSELDIPVPDYHLEGVMGKTHAEQTGNMMIELEQVFQSLKPKCIIVYGDINSTLSASLSAVKLHIPVIHVESGLRSFDRKMPEEVNRVLVDNISDYLFCIDSTSVTNLKNEGITNGVYLSGNLMIDTLKTMTLEDDPTDCVLMTLHRPSNVDDKDRLFKILNDINLLGEKVLFPVHPRVSKMIGDTKFSNIEIVNPMGYKEFITNLKNCKYAISDSGGVQCESSVLNTPLITLRDSSEHPDTIKFGTNTLCLDSSEIKDIKLKHSNHSPEIWDGNSAERIVKILRTL